MWKIPGSKNGRKLTLYFIQTMKGQAKSNHVGLNEKF